MPWHLPVGASASSGRAVVSDVDLQSAQELPVLDSTNATVDDAYFLAVRCRGASTTIDRGPCVILNTVGVQVTVVDGAKVPGGGLQLHHIHDSLSKVCLYLRVMPLVPLIQENRLDCVLKECAVSKRWQCAHHEVYPRMHPYIQHRRMDAPV